MILSSLKLETNLVANRKGEVYSHVLNSLCSGIPLMHNFSSEHNLEDINSSLHTSNIFKTLYTHNFFSLDANIITYLWQKQGHNIQI